MIDFLFVVGFKLIMLFFSLLRWGVIIWALLSWFSQSRSPLGKVLDDLIIPLIRPFRWARIGLFDLSPIVLLFLIEALHEGAMRGLFYLQTFL